MSKRAERRTGKVIPSAAARTVPQQVESVRRALRILRCFRAEQPELGVTEIARELRLPKSTIHRLLATLEVEGFAYRVNGSRYVLGWRAFELGAAVLAWSAIRQPILRRLEALVAATGETAHLGVLDEGRVLYVEKVESDRPLRMPSAVGRRLPLHCTALGKVLAAGLEDALLVRIIKRVGLPAFTPNTITDLATLRREVEKVRKNGFALDNEEIEEGLMCVAAPVVDERGATCVAISISGPVSRVRDRLDDNIAAVREACRALSEDLGPDARKLRDVSRLGPPAETLSGLDRRRDEAWFAWTPKRGSPSSRSTALRRPTRSPRPGSESSLTRSSQRRNAPM